MTHWSVCHDSCICHGMVHSCVRHDSCMCVTWLIHFRPLCRQLGLFVLCCVFVCVVLCVCLCTPCIDNCVCLCAASVCVWQVDCMYPYVACILMSTDTCMTSSLCPHCECLALMYMYMYKHWVCHVQASSVSCVMYKHVVCHVSCTSM